MGRRLSTNTDRETCASKWRCWLLRRSGCGCRGTAVDTRRSDRHRRNPSYTGTWRRFASLHGTRRRTARTSVSSAHRRLIITVRQCQRLSINVFSICWFTILIIIHNSVALSLPARNLTYPLSQNFPSINSLPATKLTHGLHDQTVSSEQLVFCFFVFFFVFNRPTFSVLFGSVLHISWLSVSFWVHEI